MLENAILGLVCALPILGYAIEAVFDTRGNNPPKTRK